MNDEVAFQLVKRYDLEIRLKRAWNMLDRGELVSKSVLRSHLNRPVYGADVTHRDNLDELLACLSILYIGGTNATQLQRLGINPYQVIDLLDHRHVAKYYEVHYPFATPALLLANFKGLLPDRFTQKLSEEMFDDRWESLFLAFLTLNAVFMAPGPLGDFLSLIDEYKVRGIWLEDMHDAFAHSKTMKRWLKSKPRRELLEGLQDFLRFSGELDRLLESMESLPLSRGLFWLNFGYWYGSGGKRMRRVANWVITTLELTDAEAEHEDRYLARERRIWLKIVMGRLTSIEHYPSDCLQTCGPSLDRWRLSATGKKG